MTGSWFAGGGDLQSIPNRTKVTSMKEAAQVLYPPKRSVVVSQGGNSRMARSRFSTLLLEHGEKHVQDWACIAYSNPIKNSAKNNSGTSMSASSPSMKKTKPSQGTTWAAQSSYLNTPKKSKRRCNKIAADQAQITKDTYPTAHMSKWEGRLHLCSKSLVFEPNDFSRGIIRVPFSKMPEGPPKEYPSKLELAQMTADQTGQAFETMGVEFWSNRHWVMKENGSIGPYESVHVTTQFRLTFLHSSPSTMVELCQKLAPILNSKNPQDLEDLLKPMYEQAFDFQSNLQDVREQPLLQNSSLNTNASGALKCQWMQPLQNQPGCLVLTQERLYFQPSEGVLGVEYATSQSYTWLLHSQLIATARRYKGLEDAALELYWKDGTSTLFGLERKHDREQVLRLLPSHVPCHTDREFILEAYQAWRAKSITNLEYLLLLNSAAGRSYQDLSRYPVVPWVISDYESKKLDLNNPATFRDLTKPIGALNEERLEYFRQRYDSMQDAVDFPFFYGTHYSAAGYVLYYLVRSMPEQMLCLQNGKFDAPDRMFHCIHHTFKTLLTNHTDVKELIPEFFNPNLDYDFLINARGLQLGATQNGDRVNDVRLPPWAKSPRDFIKKNIKALESDVCTGMLPRWLDLIFGWKSRGEAAKEASNLFHRYAYMGPADLANLPSYEERYQAELHATEFGLVPDQLFVGPHPLRHETVDESFISQDIGRTFSGSDDLGKGDAWELLDPPSATREPGEKGGINGPSDNPALAVTYSLESSDFGLNQLGGSDLQSNITSNDELFRAEKRSSKDKALPLSGTGENTSAGLGAFSYLGREPTLSNVSSKSNTGGTGSPRSIDASKPVANSPSEWDIKFLEKIRLHDDAISGCTLVPAGGPNNSALLVSASLDGGLKVHSLSLEQSGKFGMEEKSLRSGISGTLSRFSYITMSRVQNNTESQSKLSEFRSHTSRDPIACLAMATDGHGGKVAFVGGHDDVVMAYGINSGCAVASLYSHRDAVTGLNLLVRPALMATNALWLKKATHIMVSGSWDATAKVWSVTVSNGETVAIVREPLAELFDADSSIVCVSTAAVPDSGSIVIAAGCADGSFCIWKLHSDGVKVVIHKETARRGSGPCSVVQWSSSPDGRLNLFTGFATGKVASFTLIDRSIKKNSAATVGVAVQCLYYSDGILLVGCADGGLRLIPIRDDAHFTSDLSVWNAVNGKSAPGLTSVGMSFLGKADVSGQCLCCTGAEDGSVAIFELKRVSTR